MHAREYQQKRAGVTYGELLLLCGSNDKSNSSQSGDFPRVRVHRARLVWTQQTLVGPELAQSRSLHQAFSPGERWFNEAALNQTFRSSCFSSPWWKPSISLWSSNL